MQENREITTLDADQVIKRQYDAASDAQRVVLVGGGNIDLSIDNAGLINAIREGLKDIQPVINWQEQNYPGYRQEPQQEIQTVEKTVFIPKVEIREIEKQVIVPQIEYRTIEIEKPVIVKETVYKEISTNNSNNSESKWLKIMIAIQSLTILCLIVKLFIK